LPRAERAQATITQALTTGAWKRIGISAGEKRYGTRRPYPFRRDQLEISIPGASDSKRRYVDDGAFQKTLRESAFFGLKFQRARRRCTVEVAGDDRL